MDRQESRDFARYLLETGLDQVFREEIPNQVQKGVQAGHFVVLLPRPQLLLKSGVPRMDGQDQDDPQDRGDDGRGHVIHHGPRAQAPAGFGVQA